MSPFLRRLRIPALLSLAFLVLVLGLVLYLRLPASDAGGAVPAAYDGNFNPKTEGARWEARIDAVGGQAAWEEMKAAFASTGFGIQHSAAHLFGNMLYEKIGLGGVAVCDSTFAFGCYHSFFGGALAAQGPAIIRQLDAACIEKYGPLGTGCQHGIGHGLMEFYGQDRLVTALEGCASTTQVNPLFGCTGGVFMEYNVPIILDGTNAHTESRRLDPAHPYAPCDSIPDRFRQSCHYEMGQWWDKVYGGDYATIGKLCAKIENSVYRESCYLGVGNVAAPSSNYDVKETIRKCELMPDADGRRTCRSGASWSFFAEPKSRALAPAVCEGLSDAEKIRCAKESDLIGNGERGKVQ
jgi:hypothetical protein